MVDPVTNNYGLTLPTVGGDTGTWGGILNTQDITPIDNILGTATGITITSADVTLTNTQFQSMAFTITGTLTGNRNLIVPLSQNSTSAACGGGFVVYNNSSGAFTISCKTASSNSGAGVVIPQGFRAALYSDGSNVNYRSIGLPGYAQATNGSPQGQLAGTAGSANTNTQLAYDYTNGKLYACTLTGNSTGATWTQVTSFPGFDVPQNLSLSASVTSNILTVSVLTANTGANPTAGNPVTAIFRDATVANGDPVTVQITSALSISTVVGATQGASNNVPFRLWIVLFNNGGTPVLGLINCSTGATGPLPLDETGVASSTQMSNTATSAGVFYTPSGTTVTNGAFRIIGFLSYETALATAGTYNNAPDVVQLFGPGVKKPGDIVQGPTTFVTNAQGALSNSFTSTGIGKAITPKSKVNFIHITAIVDVGAQNAVTTLQVGRNSASNLLGSAAIISASNIAGLYFVMPVEGIDMPQANTSTNYSVYGVINQGSATVNGAAGSVSSIVLREIMG